MNKIDDKIKIKDEEIRSLAQSKRISVENETKLQKNNHLLQKEVQELKMKYKTSSTDGELLYPCDKCTSTFKTAGLLIKHVKSQHENLKSCELPYPCDKCDSTFKTAGLVIKHVKSEHKKLPVIRPQ